MKWFDNWFLKHSRKAWERVQLEPPVLRSDIGYLNKKSISRDLNSPSTSFRTYNANGGTVVEVSYYDVTTDRSSTSLHVIPKDEDLGQALAHIITYEVLKR
jgi:hypothetical protein